MSGNIIEINESDKKYQLDKLTPLDKNWKDLFSQELLIYEQYSRFWRPRLNLGKKCMDVMRRDIFTAQQRADYEAQNKVPVEPQELKRIINSLAEEIKKAVQSSNISTEDDTPPENAAKPEVVNVVLKDMENKINMNMIRETVIRNGLITGFPQWIWYDFMPQFEGLFEELVGYHPLWNSMLPTPFFEKRDGSDIDDVIRIGQYSKAALLEMYPDREKAVKDFDSALNDDPGYFKSSLQQSGTEDAMARAKLIELALNAVQYDSMEGYYMVAERNFPVMFKQDLYYNEKISDVQVLPENWKRERKRQWVQDNPEYKFLKQKNVKTLWTTTIGLNGFIWANGPHWFQENGKLPGTPYVPDMLDNIPTGVGEDQLPYIYTIAASETEGLHSVKVNQGTYTFVLEGAFKYPASVGKEMGKQDGIIIIDKTKAPGGQIEKVVKTFQRKPNDVPFSFADRTRAQGEGVHSVNDSILGATHPRQSAVSKKTEIKQGMSPQAPYVHGYSHFDINNKQTQLYLLPYVYTEERIITINDDFGMNRKQVTVNITENPYTDQARIVANDLISVRYRAVPVPGEDSATSRERELQEFVDLLRAVGNQLFQIDPEFMAQLFNAIPNRYSKMAANVLMKSAQQASQSAQQISQQEQQLEVQKETARRGVDVMKIQTPKMDLSVPSAQEIEEYPRGSQMVIDLMNQYSKQGNQP